MKNIILFLAVFSFLISCTKNSDGGVYNELDNPGSEIFRIDSTDFVFASQNRKDIVLYFTPLVYDQLTDVQKEKISGYRVFKNGSERFNFLNDRDWFIDTDIPNGSTVCYSVAYRTDEGISNRSDEWCYTIPF